MIWNVEVTNPIRDNKIEGQSSELVRLIQDEEIEKNVKFDEVSVPDPDTGFNDSTGAGGDMATQTAGFQYPIIRINDFVFGRKNVIGMTLSSIGLLPTISVTLAFIDTAFMSKSMPKDGDIISLYLRTSTGALQYIRCDFIITGCRVITSRSNSDNRLTISGKLFIPKFDSTNTTFGFIGTSKELMKFIAKKFEIGFAFNDYDDTDDMQDWIACNQSMETFIDEVMPHIWKDNTSFFRTWIDFYYDLCFVNVNKFLLTTENKEEVDVTFYSNAINMMNQLAVDQTAANAKPYPKILSNSEDFRGTPFFVSEWKPVNNSSAISFKTGYTTVSYNFVHNQNIMSNDIEESFQQLDNIPAYDQNKVDTYIVLRGRAKYEEGQNPEDEQKRVNYDFVNTYINRDWEGVEYMIDPDETNKEDNSEWSGNVHKNYSRAVQHNKININELGKIYLQVTCDGLNVQIMRGERVPIYLLHANTVDDSQVNNTGNDVRRSAHRFYSGYYIVDSVIYTYNPDFTGSTPFRTMFTLCRREWPTPEAI